MSKGGSRRPTTGGEGQGGGFVAGDNPYREPYSNPYRQGGFRVPMGQSGDYSRAGQRSGSLGNKGGQQRPPYMPSPYERQPQYNEGPRFPSRGNAKGGIGGMAPPPSSRYNPQRPDYTAQPYRPTTPNFRQIGRDALANTSSGGFGSSPNPPPQENLMQPAVQPPMNPSKGENYRPMPAPVQQPMPAPVAPQPMPMPVQQPQPAMMPNKGGMNLPVQQPMPAPMPMVQPIPQAQPMPAMMPSKGGMPMTQFNPQPVPPIQSPSFTPSRQIRSPLGPRNMRYGR